MPSTGCSWPARSDGDTANVAYPDQSATYWLAQLPASPAATGVTIRGQFPVARYFSFVVYDGGTSPAGELSDHQIAPDPPSRNPFAQQGAPFAGHYTAHIAFTATPHTPAPNTIYAPLGVGTVTILYRVYVPLDPKSPSGSVPLPRLALDEPGGTEADLGQCSSLPPSTNGAGNQTINGTSYPAGAPTAVPLPNTTDPPTFMRSDGLGPQNPVTGSTNTVSFLPNPDTAYVSAKLSRQFGAVVAVRFRVPTFPNTTAGQDVTTRADMRYWSVCMNETYTERYVQCSADYQTKVDRNGVARFVIADPGQRPANASPARGINYLPWPGAYYSGLIIYRNMLPARGFAQSTFAVAPGQPLTTQMGAYGPEARYCSRTTIETKGFDACFPDPPPTARPAPARRSARHRSSRPRDRRRSRVRHHRRPSGRVHRRRARFTG